MSEAAMANEAKVEAKKEEPRKLRAATGKPALSGEQWLALFKNVESAGADRVLAFAAALRSAEFTTASGSERDGRTWDAHAYAWAKFPNPGDHRLRNCDRVLLWLLHRDVRAATVEADTRGKEVLFEVRLRRNDLPKREAEAAVPELAKLMERILPPALAQACDLLVMAAERVIAVANARHALSEAAKASVEAARLSLDYAARLAALREEVRRDAATRLAAQGFADLASVSMLLITPEARERALALALSESPFAVLGGDEAAISLVPPQEA